MILTPESGVPGAPVATSHPDHQPRVPTTAGVPPFCSCGYVGGNGSDRPGDRPLLASHLYEMERQLMGTDENGEQTWTTEELQRDFTVTGFAAPYVVVIRKVDQVKGSLQFTHSPRVYFGWRVA